MADIRATGTTARVRVMCPATGRAIGSGSFVGDGSPFGERSVCDAVQMPPWCQWKHACSVNRQRGFESCRRLHHMQKEGKNLFSKALPLLNCARFSARRNLHQGPYRPPKGAVKSGRSPPVPARSTAPSGWLEACHLRSFRRRLPYRRSSTVEHRMHGPSHLADTDP